MKLGQIRLYLWYNENVLEKLVCDMSFDLQSKHRKQFKMTFGLILYLYLDFNTHFLYLSSVGKTAVIWKIVGKICDILTLE